MAAPDRLEFRLLTRADFAFLVEWLAQPHVARWWDEEASLAHVEEEYGPVVDGIEPTLGWIVEIDGTAAGFVQCYRHRDYPEHDAAVGVSDAAGIDYLLSRPYVGRGVGAAMVAAFTDVVFGAYPDVRCCVAAPAQENTASWRCLDRAGYQRVGTCRPPGDPPCFTYVRPRAQPPSS
jgi:aminoglycoside 6'-N-acetyltransferase